MMVKDREVGLSMIPFLRNNTLDRVTKEAISEKYARSTLYHPSLCNRSALLSLEECRYSSQAHYTHWGDMSMPITPLPQVPITPRIYVTDYEVQ